MQNRRAVGEEGREWRLGRRGGRPRRPVPGLVVEHYLEDSVADHHQFSAFVHCGGLSIYGVIQAEHYDRSSVAVMAGAAESLLTRLDPDLEWAVREDAIHLIVARFDCRWTEALATQMRVARGYRRSRALFHAGVQADSAAIERYLTKADARTVRRPAPLSRTHDLATVNLAHIDRASGRRDPHPG